VIIVDGASFRGRIDMGEVDVESAGVPRPRAVAAPARPVLRPAAARPTPPPKPEPKKVEEKVAMPVAAPRPPAPPAPVAMGAVKRKVIVKRK
jgi:hypothetical protein